MASMEKGESQELNLILKGDVSGSVEALEDALAQDRRRRRGQPPGHRPRCRCDHRDQRRPGRRLRRHHHRLQRPARRARRPRWPTRKASRSGTTRSSTRRSRRSRRPSRACSSRSSRSRSLGQAEIREIFRSSKIGNIAGCMVTGGVIRRNAKARLLRDGAVVADNLDLASLQAGEGRRVRGPRGLRVRPGAQELPGHQDRRCRGVVRDARDPARLTTHHGVRSTALPRSTAAGSAASALPDELRPTSTWRS